MSRGVIVCGGSADNLLAHDGADTLAACGDVTRSGAVMPAWLMTFTRNSRVPACTRSGGAAPRVTLTRASGLTWTIASTWPSSTDIARATPLSVSGAASAASKACRSPGGSGWPS